jgi:hypothetical protein
MFNLIAHNKIYPACQQPGPAWAGMGRLEMGQVAGAGDAGVGAEMGDGDGGHQLSAVLQKFVDGKINIFCNLSEQNR